MDGTGTMTVSGPPGSGTSTLCRLLSDRLGLRYVYVGALFRELASKHGMSLEDFGAHVADNEDVDRELDAMAAREIRKGWVILEGRLAAHMAAGVPAFRIFMDAHPEERCRRVGDRDGGSGKEVMARMLERESNERERYLRVYDLDLDDLSVYDLTVDCTRIPPEELADIVVSAYERWKRVTG